ncbi:hypothetical protein ZOSMA_141G00220 [Zostera marina]|uniref:Uncharacterized protein n=1 Tax=Zostera marina TaxID=29655 RepID=A0A0K9PZX1_ZOSMR|nr:hypothetical protein ZOSMA_141G00220 [Zostera marina]
MHKNQLLSMFSCLSYPYRIIYYDEFGGLIHSAHSVMTESEFLTLIPDLLWYLAVRMEVGSNERKVIGRVDCSGSSSSAG